ncbi:MAG TPA: glycosyltransferase family 4 protein [Polyangiaceae bacterium]
MANRSPDSSKLRFLFVHTATRPPLGADTWIQALIIRHLDRSRHEVNVACATGPESQPTPTFSALGDIPELSIKPVNFGSELFAKSLVERGEAAWDHSTDPGPVRADLGIAPDAPVVICVARIFRGKGQALLIQALALLTRKLPQIKLLIVGQDYPPKNNHTNELRALCAELGVTGNVIFTGLRSDVPRLLAAADILAMPSFQEPFGLVYAEAMAMKKPVIAFDNGGTPEVVEHEKTGLLSPQDDVPALAANLRRLVKDPELRTRMGEYGRQRVETRFVPRRLAEDVARVYTEVMGRTSAS